MIYQVSQYLSISAAVVFTDGVAIFLMFTDCSFLSSKLDMDLKIGGIVSYAM